MTEKRESNLLSTSAVARVLGITPDGVRYLARTGQLPAQYLSSGQRIFNLSDVEKLARARGVRGEIEPSDAA